MPDCSRALPCLYHKLHKRWQVIDKRDETWDAIKTQSEAAARKHAAEEKWLAVILRILHTDMLQEAAKLQAPPAVVNQADSSRGASFSQQLLQLSRSFNVHFGGIQ